MAYRALCRFLEARTGLGAIAIYERYPGGFALAHATPGYRALMSGARCAPPAAPQGDRLRSVEPGPLGLVASSICLVQPMPGPGDGQGDGPGEPPGFIVIASLQARRTGTRLEAAMRDAAIIGAEIARLRLIEGTSGPADPRGLPDATAPPVARRPAAAPTALRLPPPLIDAEPPESPSAQALRRQERLAIASLPRDAVHQLIASILRARSRGDTLVFMMIDIDRFRAVNEALGSEAGDLVLAETGARLEACLGARDRLIRLEGDRFLVVTAAERGPAQEVAAELLQAVAEPIDLPTRRVALGASIGVVQARAAETSPVRLLMQADSALRRAKHAGGGRVAFHEPGAHAALLDRSLLELDLRHALEAGQFAMVYQPYLALDTGRPAGAEALLRWHHPTRGEIAPATFIPLAEASGLILPLGIWALGRACAEAARWHGDFTLAVNISPLQFHAPGFVESIDAVLAATGFPAQRLELEITETVLMRDNPETNAQLRALIARGIRIALDDFGTGYSALAYLSRLPHHRIKLDKSFVEDLGRPSTAGLVRAIIALARAGGIATTAEGVERPDQLAAIRALGFTHAQGFATGAPARDLSAFRTGVPAG